MIDPDRIIFPLRLDRFISMQEAELGRKATPTEREFFSDVVEMANATYRAGCVADADTVQALLDTLVAIDTSEDTRHLCALCRGWILLGARRGLELLDSLEDPPVNPSGLRS